MLTFNVIHTAVRLCTRAYVIIAHAYRDCISYGIALLVHSHSMITMHARDRTRTHVWVLRIFLSSTLYSSFDISARKGKGKTINWQQLLHVCTLCTILVVSYCAKYKLVCQHERYHSTCTCTCLHRSFNLIQFHQDCWQNNRVLFFFLFRPGRPVASSLLLRLRWATARIGPTVIANSRTKFWKK